jgi:hypothetical protein
VAVPKFDQFAVIPNMSGNVTSNVSVYHIYTELIPKKTGYSCDTDGLLGKCTRTFNEKLHITM